MKLKTFEKKVKKMAKRVIEETARSLSKTKGLTEEQTKKLTTHILASGDQLNKAVTLLVTARSERKAAKKAKKVA